MPKKKNKKEIESENYFVDIADKQNKFEIVFSWSTVDFIKNHETKFYLILTVMASMGMILWGIFTGSLTVIFVFIILAFVSIAVLNEDPREIKIRIDEKGVNINQEHFNFEDFISFKIIQMHGLPVLSLTHKEKYLPAKMIYVEKEPVNDLRDFLGIYLMEEE